MLGVAPHERVVLDGIPRHVLDGRVAVPALGVAGEVVARAEGGAVAGENHHVHVRVRIGLGHRGGERDRQIVVDRIHDLGTVQGDAADAAVLLVENLAHDDDARCA